jgi:hypothetical protein
VRLALLADFSAGIICLRTIHPKLAMHSEVKTILGG